VFAKIDEGRRVVQAPSRICGDGRNIYHWGWSCYKKKSKEIISLWVNCMGTGDNHGDNHGEHNFESSTLENKVFPNVLVHSFLFQMIRKIQPKLLTVRLSLALTFLVFCQLSKTFLVATHK
jgi:hypothetical protein